MIDPAVNAHYVGDCRELLKRLPDGCVQTCVTSPPYWGLRDYGNEGQIGLEKTPDAYVRELVAVFAEVRRTLRKDGTLWVNIGDCHATGGSKVGEHPGGGAQGERWKGHREGRATHNGIGRPGGSLGPMTQPNRMPIEGLKPKDLVGIPWRLAFALQADGWWLRADIIWHKPDPMPMSVKDRPTPAHEYVFLLSKSKRYHYDAAAIAEPATEQRSGHKARRVADGSPGQRPSDQLGAGIPWENTTGTRNRRSVWTICTSRYEGAHFATFPPKLVEPCILAGAPPRFARAGSVLRLGHHRRRCRETRPTLDRLRSRLRGSRRGTNGAALAPDGRR